MKKYIIIIILVFIMANCLSDIVGDELSMGEPTAPGSVFYEDSNGTFTSTDDIIRYYKLYNHILQLEANIDTLEQKIEVMEKAVEHEVFDDNKLQQYDQNYSHPFIQPIDPIKEEYWEWQKKKWKNMPQMPDLEYQEFLREREKKAKADTTTYKISVGSTYDSIFFAITDSLTVCEKYIDGIKITDFKDSRINKLTKEVNMLWEAIHKIQGEE